MSRIDELIRELCPEGVEFKPLSDISRVTKGTQVNKEFLSDRHPYPVYNGGVGPSGNHTESNFPANTITVSQGGASAGYVNFVTQDLWVGAHCYAITPSSKVDNRFLYFFIKSQEPSLQANKYGAGIPALDKATLNSLGIPVPPLEVQREIVSILDKFTQLEAELEAELEARKSQYEVTRDRLLDFSGDLSAHPMGELIQELCPDGVPMRPIGSFANCVSGATPNSSNAAYWSNGTVPWMSSGEVNKGVVFETEKKISKEGFDSCSTKMVPANSVVMALAGQGKTRGMVAITRIELCTNQSLCSIICDAIVIPEFLLHYLHGQYQNLRSLSSGDGGRGGLNLGLIRAFTIPVPPLEVQREIVSILDKIDALVNDISYGLPAEIEARRKQYEYYRNKLLTFKELDAA